MTAQPSLREFFEQELNVSQDGLGDLGFDNEASMQHLVSHLTEQTVHRAALDAATHRRAPDQMTDTGSTEESWKRHVMVAALAELRPVKLLARN
jgi:hypothetical protein